MPHRTPAPPARSFRLPRLAAALALAFLAACGGGGEGEKADEPPLPEGFTRLPEGAALPVAEASLPQCNAPSTRSVFRRAIEWEAFWVFREECTAPPVPQGIDFSKEMLVLAAMGKRTSPDEKIAIVGSAVRNDTTVVLVRRSILPPQCPDQGGRHFPAALARVPANDGRVKFLEERTIIPCGGT